MSSYNSTRAVDLTVGEDLNGDVYEALTIDSDGRVVKASATSDVIIGVLAEDPGRTTVDGVDTVPVDLIGAGGIGQIKAQAAIDAGDFLIPTATAGRVSGVTGLAEIPVDVMACGVALEAATAAGDIISFLAMPIAGANV